MFRRGPTRLPLSLVEALEDEYAKLQPAKVPDPSWLLWVDDVIDAPGFLKRIGAARDPRVTDPVTRLLRDRMDRLDWTDHGEPTAPQPVRGTFLGAIDAWDGTPGAMPSVCTLVEHLNVIIATEANLYQDNRTAFEGVCLSDWTRGLAMLQLEGVDLLQRNRLLLHEAYPQFIRSRLGRHYALIHQNASQRAALVLSGGGIRSATFGLGLLQGLARQAPTGQGPAGQGLLGEFDYLSTVSGGGYIGGWLTAWMHHHPSRQQGVLADLARNPEGPLDPEPSPVQHLRSYSNYLTPRLGLMSADTWSLISIIVRNMVLNWAVLLPLFVAVLALPRIAVAAAHWGVPGYNAVIGLQLFGYLSLLWAVGFAAFNLPAGRREPPRVGEAMGKVSESSGEGTVLRLAVVPIVASAFAESLAWAWVIHLHRVFHEGATFWLIAIAGAGLGVVGLAAYLLRMRLIYRDEFCEHLPWSSAQEAGTRPLWERTGGFVLSLTALLGGTAAGAAVLTWLLLPIRFTASTRDGLNGGLFMTVAPAAALALMVTATAFFVGISSRWMDDDSREWLGRLCAWLLIAAVPWLALCTLVVFAPTWLLGWRPIYRTAATVFGTASGVVAVFAGRSSSTPGPNQPQGKTMQQMLVDNALQLASLAFVVALAVRYRWQPAWPCRRSSRTALTPDCSGLVRSGSLPTMPPIA